MPRIPRKCYDTSFFHVIVQGLNKEYIFNEERYKKQYLKLLKQYKENNRIEILAYCIMGNHAHILLYTEKIVEMSKFMQKVNTKYAKYYNYMNKGRVGYVFRDRYVSEGIKNERYLIKCINYIHKNPLKAQIVERCEDYKYSSYNNYITGEKLKKLEEILNSKLNRELFINMDGEYAFKDIDNNINEDINLFILDFLSISNIKKEEAIADKVILKLLIKYLKKDCKVKYTQIMSCLNISKGQMERLKLRRFFLCHQNLRSNTTPIRIQLNKCILMGVMHYERCFYRRTSNKFSTIYNKYRRYSKRNRKKIWRFKKHSTQRRFRQADKD